MVVKANNKANIQRNYKYKINNKTFKNKTEYIEYVMSKTGRSSSVIYKRIRKFGTYDPRVFYSGEGQIKFIVKIKGKYFFNIPDIADAFKLSYSVVSRRIKNYGLNDPDLILPTSEYRKVKGGSRGKEIYYQGHNFKSVREMARFYGLPVQMLWYRIKHYGLDYKELLSDHQEITRHARRGKKIEYKGEKYASYSDMARKNNITRSQAKLRMNYNQNLSLSTKDLRNKSYKKSRGKKAHRNNLLTAEEVSEKTGYSLDQLRRNLSGSSLGRASEFVGLLNLHQFVEQISNNSRLKFNYAYNPKVVTFIQNYFKQIKQKHLVMVPQLRQMYFWDTKNEEFYSLNARTGSFFLKVQSQKSYKKDKLGKAIKSKPYVLVQLIPGAPSQSKYYISEIKSLIKHPDVFAKDLITITQIQNSHPEINRRNLTSTVLAKYKVPFYRRHFPDGRVISGYLPKDVNRLVFNKNR